VRSSIFILLFVFCVFVVEADAQRSARPQAVLVAEIGKGGRVTPVQRAQAPVSKQRVSNASHYSLERQTFHLLNAERASRGLDPLTWDDRVAEIARVHSNNMADQQFFSHWGKDGSTVDSRAGAFGVNDWRSIAENIAFLNGYDDPASSAVQRWMGSPSHRKNLLGRNWNRSAIGVAVARDGSIYFTQVFMAMD
jgi:uncharacterized protein YkwD